MRILGIETSCDETAAAVVEAKGLGSRGPRTRASSVRGRQVSELRVLSNVVASQIKIHAKTGGVVPEVAARVHVEKIIPVVDQALKEAKIGAIKLGPIGPNFVGREFGHNVYHRAVDVIAVTAGPGLVTSLLVGVEVARTLAWLWKKPLVAVNHLAGHIYANWLSVREIPNSKIQIPKKFQNPKFKFPILCLVVSGGHTEIVLMRKHLDFKIIGETRDDAAGEAFDKVAKMLGLGYPGGPAISKLAEQYRGVIASPSTRAKLGAGLHSAKQSPTTAQRSPRRLAVPRDDGEVYFPRPMIDSPDFDFSFSGLKTAVLYFWREQQNKVRPDLKMLRRILPEICWEFQEAVVDVLVSKTVRAAKKFGVKIVLLGGGVAANKRLRTQLVNTVNRELKSVNCIMPPAEYTTDNAAMIAAAGYFMAQAKQFTPWQKLEVDPNWALGQKMRRLVR